MSLLTYADLKTQLTNWLARSDLTSFYDDWVTLFEAAANRRLRVRQMEATAILTPTNPTSITISNAANNGSGLIRLTVTSTTGITTNDEMTVTGVTGTTEANGSWVVTVIDSVTLDLQSSTFTNAYTSGGTIIGVQGRSTLPSDYLLWRRVTWTGNPRRELEYVEPSWLQFNYPDNPSGDPNVFTIEGTHLTVRPVSGTTLELEYYQKIAALSGTVNWLYAAHPDVYLFGSLAEAYTFQKDVDSATLWKGRRDEVFSEIEMLSNKTRGVGGMKIMGPTP